MSRKKGFFPDLGDFPRFDFSNFSRSGEILIPMTEDNATNVRRILAVKIHPRFV
jgi:hypothetical protein